MNPIKSSIPLSWAAGDAWKRGALSAVLQAAKAVKENPPPADWRHLGWHATYSRVPLDRYSRETAGWPDADPRIALDAGEGFGFHYGTLRAALERAMRTAPGPDRVRYIDVWAPRDMPIAHYDKDIGFWGSPPIWANEAGSRGWRNYTDTWSPETRDGIAAGLKQMTWMTPRDELRQVFLDNGVPTLSYVNKGEDVGSLSYVTIDPSQLRWGSRAKFDRAMMDPARKADVNLTSAVGPLGVLAILAAARRDGRA